MTPFEKIIICINGRMNRISQSKQCFETAFNALSNFLGNRNCFLCHQSSEVLVCKCCIRESALPLFPLPGHNLLDYPKVSTNLLTPAYESLIALGRYEGILKGLINQLKFSRQPLAAKVLVTLFCQYLGTRLTIKQNIPDALVPIPLSKLRHTHRQFNQSRLLSQALAEHFGIVSYDLLNRVKHTKQQSRLNKEDRQSNIRNAFAVRGKFEFQSIAIVDDVITTGATVNEACLAIQEAYPDAQISVWCMATTIR
jgi:ComF family protein